MARRGQVCQCPAVKRGCCYKRVIFSNGGVHFIRACATCGWQIDSRYVSRKIVLVATGSPFPERDLPIYQTHRQRAGEATPEVGKTPGKCACLTQPKGTYMQVIFRNGTQHVLQICPVCGRRCHDRTYISHQEAEELGLDLDRLPVHKDNRRGEG